MKAAPRAPTPTSERDAAPVKIGSDEEVITPVPVALTVVLLALVTDATTLLKPVA